MLRCSRQVRGSQSITIGDDVTVAHALEVACVVASEPAAWLRYSTEFGQIAATTGNTFQSIKAAARETHALISLGQRIAGLADPRRADFVLDRSRAR